jgi:O-antigen ligase
VTVSISASLGGSLFYGAQALVSFLGISFGAYAAVRLLGPERTLNWMIVTFTVILAASALLSVLLPSVGTHTGLYFPGQWRGAFGHKNQLGFLAAMTLLLVMPTINWRPFWQTLTALTLALLCLIMARSGSSIILFASGSVILLSVMFLRKMKTDQAVIVVAVALSLLLGFVLKDYILSFISLTLEKDRTFSGRTAIWQKMLELGNERPFFGHGPYYLAIDTQFLERARSALNFPQLRSAHNSYIENLIEFGYIGLIIFLIPSVIIVLKWIANRNLDINIYYIIISVQPVLVYFTAESSNRIYTGVATLVINILFCVRQPAFRRPPPIGMPAHG